MQTFIRVIQGIGMAALIGIAMPVMAESAPVYDADSLPQQFDNGAEQGQDLPPPPLPSQDGSFGSGNGGAQLPAPSPQSSQPMSLEQRVRRAEQQINNMQNTDSSTRVDSLQNQVQTLRGQVEQLTHELQQLQEQQKSMYADLDKRLTQLKSGAVATSVNKTNPMDEVEVLPSPAAAKIAAKKKAQPPVSAEDSEANAAAGLTAANQPNVAEEQQIYQTAYDLIKAKKYDQAVKTLQGMLQKYPSGQFASNAHYWLGELYGLLGKNDQALTEFSNVVQNYPESPRVSDAQLKIGLIYASQMKWPDAKSAFKKVINRYPGTTSSRLASEQLKQIKQAGH